jgi:hypothetical protein
MKKKSLFLIVAIILASTAAYWLAANTNILDPLRSTDLTIHWTTESELDIIGFNLYRSTTPDGEFIKVNNEMIPSSPDPFVGGEYTYVDQGVIRGETYYSELETLDRQGNVSRKGPYAIPAGN